MRRGDGWELTDVRVLLVVIDWVDQVEPILAARDAIAKLGAEVVGVSFVVATNATLLTKLKDEQLLFSCSWSPAPGAEVALCGDQSITRSIVPEGEAVVQNLNCSCHHPGPHRSGIATRKRKRSFDEDAPLLPQLMHFTAQYQVQALLLERFVTILDVV